jgi:hypothetical protein
MLSKLERWTINIDQCHLVTMLGEKETIGANATAKIQNPAPPFCRPVSFDEMPQRLPIGEPVGAGVPLHEFPDVWIRVPIEIDNGLWRGGVQCLPALRKFPGTMLTQPHQADLGWDTEKGGEILEVISGQ